MKLVKYNFECPVCNKEFFTYVEFSNIQRMIDTNFEDVFEEYPECYKIIMRTSICQNCQQSSYAKTICASSDKQDSSIYSTIEQMESDARKTI